MIEILIVLAIILSLALIVLVTIQPRKSTISMDATSNIGKPSYWQSNTLVKFSHYW